MSTAVAVVSKIPGINMATIAVLEVVVTTMVMLECFHRTDSRLERQREVPRHTHPTRHEAHGRLEDGTTYSLTVTTMANVISTCIPTHQPNGTLAVPAEFWSQLRIFIGQLGGSLEVEETRKRGFIFGDCKGLPVYQLVVTLPDDVDVEDALSKIDQTLKHMIRGFLTPAVQEQPA